MKGKRNISTSQNIYGYLFISPFIIGFIFFFIKPLIQTIIFSFSNITINPGGYSLTGIGFNNYNAVFIVDTQFKRLLTESIISLLPEIPITIFISLFLASILNMKFKGRILARVILFLPVIIYSGIISLPDLNLSIITNSALNDEGTFTGTLISSLMLERMFTRFAEDLQGSLNIVVSPAIINGLISIFNGIYLIITKSGVQILLFLAAIQSIPKSVYEASKIEGANGWDNYWLITFPMISPFILTSVVYTIIDSFNRSSNTLTKYIQDNAILSFEGLSYATAMSVMYSTLILVILGITGMISHKLVNYYEK